MILNKNYSAIIFFFIGLLSLSAQEEESQDSIPVNSLDEVVVTATRTVRQLSSLPLPVTLVDKKQLKQTGVTRLNEILSEQTGIVMTPDATIGGGEGVQIQGIASDYVMVLIDGVPVVGRSSGNLDLSRLAVGNIRQVEVVKGPSSSLFGSEALGGVINIITEKPSSDKISTEISHRTATFNNQNTTVNVSQGKGDFNYALFIDRLSTDGYDLAPQDEGQTINPFYNYTLNGRMTYKVNGQWNMFASARYFYQEFDTSPDVSQETDSNIHLRADHSPAEKHNLQYELYYTRYTTDERTSDPIDPEVFVENNFDQRLFRPEIRYNFSPRDGQTLTTGAGYNFETLDRSLFGEQVRFDSRYLFAQYDFRPLEKLNVIAGARFDNHSVYNSQLSPKISARYALSSAIALKGSVGSGFKAPDFRQLYLDFNNVSGGGYSVFGKEVEAAGIQRLEENGELASLQVDRTTLGEPLEAESSVGINLGLDFRKGNFSSSVNYFQNDFRDLIDTRILATKTSGQGVFGYLNRERVRTQGMEVDLQYRPVDRLKFSGGYQFLLAYDRQARDEVKNGEVFARDPETNRTVRLEQADYFGLENRSRHTFNLKAFYEIPAWKANTNLRLTYRSRFGLTDRNGNGLLDELDNSFVQGYALVNLSFEKEFYKHYRLQVGANNLLDFKGRNPLAAQDSELLINPGIQIFSKLNIQF